VVVWIGRAVWPHVHGLVRREPVAEAETAKSSVGGSTIGDRGLLRASLLVDATTTAERLWALELALRSSATVAVIADGSGFDMVATRRVQLAAEASGGLALLARPPSERSILSAATTRWMVRPRAVVHERRAECWSNDSAAQAHGDLLRLHGWWLELVRRKSRGVDLRRGATAAKGSLDGHPFGWPLERDDATGAVAVAADVVDRSGATARAPFLQSA
jgi:hypothetical protein